MTVVGYIGSDWGTGRFAEGRALDAGLSSLRARVVGNISSHRDGWTFRKTLAKHCRCSVRTVQRAITQAKLEGLLGVARAKPGEVPIGLQRPLECGWSHRWTIGRDLAGPRLRAATESAKARALLRLAMQRRPPVPGRIIRAERSPAELEARRQQMKAALLEAEQKWAAEDAARARAGPGRDN